LLNKRAFICGKCSTNRLKLISLQILTQIKNKKVLELKEKFTQTKDKQALHEKTTLKNNNSIKSCYELN